MNHLSTTARGPEARRVAPRVKQTGGRSGKSCTFGEAVKARVGELLALARIVLLEDFADDSR